MIFRNYSSEKKEIAVFVANIAHHSDIGGKDGASGSFWLTKGDEEKEKLNSKVSDISLGKDDLITVFTPGVGGYGNPLERSVEKVLQDVKEGKVSVASAKYDYGVLLTEDLNEVDLEATEKYRAENK